MNESPWKLMGRTLVIASALAAAGLYAFASRPSLQVVAQLSGTDERSLSKALAGLDSMAASARADGESPQIEVVVTDDALASVRRASPLCRQIERLQAQGVVFAIGGDALRRGKLPEWQFPAGFLVVPSAVYEIARLEKRRFEYIRP